MTAHESPESGLRIQDMEGTLASLIGKVRISDTVKDSVNKAAVILYPLVGFRDIKPPPFPVGTDGLFVHLKKNLPADLPVEVCINDEDYHELTLHADLSRLGIIIVKYVALPVVLGVLGSYIYDKLKGQPSGQAEISFSIIMADDKENLTKQFDYEGPAKDFETIADEIKGILETRDE